ncbi:MAG: hypothetical protein HFJ20_04215 [Clostridia bacterium]|nr:hypothetical protein [Clostridia bacterium]
MNRKRIIAISAIIALIILSFLTGTTFAKYLTEYKTTGSLQIARWSVSENFLVNGVSKTSENINLATTYNPKTLVNGKIAPGTSGTFGVQIDATGTETGINYEIKFDRILGAIINNLVFIYNNNTYSNLSELSNAVSGNIPADADNKIVNLEIGWCWPYETLVNGNSANGDEQDTLDGSTIYNSKYSFDVTITCTQDIPKV